MDVRQTDGPVPVVAVDTDTMGDPVFVVAERMPARGAVCNHGSGSGFEVLDTGPRSIKRRNARDRPALTSGR